MEIDAGLVLQVLGGLLKKPDPIEQLRRQVEEQRLRAELGGMLPAAAVTTPAELMSVRRDFAIVGQRGAGKTAAAFALALAGPRRPILAVDWQGALPHGVTRASFVNAARTPGACLILDEAALRIGIGQRTTNVWETMALARQRDQVVIWTSQSAAALDLHVLRQGVTIAWLAGESRFERPELEDEARVARGLLTANQTPHGSLAACVDGRWLLTRPTLPPGWSHDVSTAWAGHSR